MFAFLLTALLTVVPAHGEEPCEGGRLITTDSLGHCCWEGQAWNGSSCVGAPVSCPDGLRVDFGADSCVERACPEGQGRLPSGNCCWEGQVWVQATFSCEGTPTACPAGTTAAGDACFPVGKEKLLVGILGTRQSLPPVVTPAAGETCPQGQALAADGVHCCDPGQGWSSLRGYCVGGTLIGRGGLGATGRGGLGLADLGDPTGGDPTGGDPVILGALDKSLIDAVIKHNMSEVRDCYQRELVKSHALSGKITVKFVIARDGAVSSAVTKSTTMNNPVVEQCINDEFLKFQFPEPKGGGIVIVSYPFVFQPG